MSKHEITKRVEIKTVTITRYAREDLRKVLGITTPTSRLRIFVEVPGGGDWSNEDLEIDGKICLVVEETSYQVAEEKTAL